MTLRSKFRNSFAKSSPYPFLRIVYRKVSSVLGFMLRKTFQITFSAFGIQTIYPRYAVVSLPINRPLLVIRGFKGVTIIGRKHYFSRHQIVRNYLEKEEVQDFISDIRDISGMPVCPISILESALIKEGAYLPRLTIRNRKVTATHVINRGNGSDIFIPRESSFFHFFIQVSPFLLRQSSENTLWLDLDPDTSNLEVLRTLGLSVDETLGALRLRKISQVAVQTNHYPSSHEIRFLRKRIKELGFLRSPEVNLYITRKGNINGRHIENESELLVLLNRYNFKIVDPGLLSFFEQLSLFGRAKIVVAPHGAALSHIVNFPSDASILELNSDTDVRWHIRKMAKSLGISHQLLLGKNSGVGSFQVNLELVEEFLQQSTLNI
jgi:hypothetical protein